MCDPDRHFGLVVPQRAKHCPALLNAIYTASARHLCRLDQYRNNNEVKYLGNRMPELRTETAIEYHTRCIEHFAVVAHDSQATFDENLLAASIILRLYEEIDGMNAIFVSFNYDSLIIGGTPCSPIQRRRLGNQSQRYPGISWCAGRCCCPWYRPP